GERARRVERRARAHDTNDDRKAAGITEAECHGEVSGFEIEIASARSDQAQRAAGHSAADWHHTLRVASVKLMEQAPHEAASRHSRRRRKTHGRHALAGQRHVEDGRAWIADERVVEEAL